MARAAGPAAKPNLSTVLAVGTIVEALIDNNILFHQPPTHLQVVESRYKLYMGADDEQSEASRGSGDDDQVFSGNPPAAFWRAIEASKPIKEAISEFRKLAEYVPCLPRQCLKRTSFQSHD